MNRENSGMLCSAKHYSLKDKIMGSAFLLFFLEWIQFQVGKTANESFSIPHPPTQLPTSSTLAQTLVKSQL